jgi:NAD(P)-dependent dehydrogenase (short-subunit alcohol dehydrogenase family)
MNNKVALVTGASSGIGYDAAVTLKNEESMSLCIDTIIKNEGRLDVLVNNAGYGSYGAIEDVPMEEARFWNSVLMLCYLSQVGSKLMGYHCSR